MPEVQQKIQSGSLAIEALFDDTGSSRAMVMTHPHPQYGGDMHNNVVDVVVRAYRKFNQSTLRFNFRGVGGSQGNYDDGRGEVTDLQATLDFLSQHNKTAIDLWGYSFGAFIDLNCPLQQWPIKRLALISPPVSLMDFSQVGSCPQLQLVISGSNDQIASVDDLKQFMPRWNPEAKLRVLEGADHFYFGYIDELTSEIERFIQYTT